MTPGQMLFEDYKKNLKSIPAQLHPRWEYLPAQSQREWDQEAESPEGRVLVEKLRLIEEPEAKMVRGLTEEEQGVV